MSSELLVEITREIAAPPEALFDAWLDPDALANFLIPVERAKVTELSLDARLGGRFHLVFLIGESRVAIDGEYTVLDRPSHLAFSWLDGGTTADSIVDLRFEAIRAGTRFTLRHLGFPDERQRTNHDEGWSRIVARLAERLAR